MSEYKPKDYPAPILRWVQDVPEDFNVMGPPTTRHLFEVLMLHLRTEKDEALYPERAELEVALTHVQDAWYRYYFMLRQKSMLQAQGIIADAVMADD